MVANEFVSIAPDVTLGADVKLGKFINLYGCSIGDETRIGAFVEIQKNATIGRRCKISSHTLHLRRRHDRRPCLHRPRRDVHQRLVSASDDRQPASSRPSRTGRSSRRWCEKGASIGSGATILSNVVIGEDAIVGRRQRRDPRRAARRHRRRQPRASVADADQTNRGVRNDQQQRSGSRMQPRGRAPTA